MAGGIDWFRWHHGSVTDPKFQLIARKSGASLPDVLAVWAYVLEQASASAERGHIGEIDAEALDCLFGFPGTETRTADILKAMEGRKLIEAGCVVAWDKRQPKREDDTAAERKRRQREREHELKMAGRVTPDDSRNVTPGHADVTHGHDRGEERREEETPSNDGVSSATPGEACKAMKAVGMQSVSPSDPRLIALLEHGITVAELVTAAAEAVERGKPFAYALKVAENRRLEASAIGNLPPAVARRDGNKHAAAARAIFGEQTPQGDFIDV